MASTTETTTVSDERVLIETVVQEYSYVYTGGSLMQMVVKTTTTPADGEATTTTETLNFTYDASGVPLSVDYDGTDYYYATNIQGDVVAILNTSGAAVVEYTYDAWGNIHEVSGTLAESLGEVNPLRYRGYVYDRESSYYYLQSRYYDPEVGRFINADSVIADADGSIQGCNLFAYCFNNPIMMSDNGGTWPKLSTICLAVAAVAITVAAVATVVATCGTAATAIAAVSGYITSSTAVTTAATVVATQSTTIAACATTAAVVNHKVEKNLTQTYSVYFLEDENGIIQYVGRVTDSGYSARMAYHRATRGLTPAMRISDLSYAEARGLEEIGMIECHTLNPSNPLNNQIHGIGSNNKNGTHYLESACNYLFNRAENSLLNLLS